MKKFLLFFCLALPVLATPTVEFFSDGGSGYYYQGKKRSGKEMDKLLKGLADAMGDDITIYIHLIKDKGNLRHFEPLIRRLQQKGFSHLVLITHENSKDLTKGSKKVTSPEKLLQQIKKTRK